MVSKPVRVRVLRRFRFHDGLRRWTINYAERHVWRTLPEHDIGDLIQDAYTVYRRVEARYGATVRDQAHFMALYKRAFANHITTLASQRTRRTQRVQFVPVDTLDVRPGDLTSDAAVLTELPEALRELYRLFVQQGVRPPVLRVDGRRETTNEWLCRIVGADPRSTDLRSMLEGLRSPT